MLTRAALHAIHGYQRLLSPRKGYACAYRILLGGTGCSGFARQAMLEARLIRALPAIRARFSACHDAAEELREPRKRKGGASNCVRVRDACDCSACSILPCGRHGQDATPNCNCQPDCCGS